MDRTTEILINRYGQHLESVQEILREFSKFDLQNRKKFFDELNFLILQSKPETTDVKKAIIDSGLKETYTPCILLMTFPIKIAIQKIITLPEHEQTKSLKLLLAMFKISYYRRFIVEKNEPTKWWYWDLSDPENLRKARYTS